MQTERAKAIVERQMRPETGPKIHPRQFLAIRAMFVSDLLTEFLDSSKRFSYTELGRNSNVSRHERRQTKAKWFYGLFDAYLTSIGTAEEKATKRRNFKLSWGKDSTKLLDEVHGFNGDPDPAKNKQGILQRVEAKRDDAFAHSEQIEPYDVHLALRRYHRTVARLEKAARPLAAQESGIPHRNRLKKIAEAGVSGTTSLAAAIGADMIGGAVGFDVLAQHYPWLYGLRAGGLWATEALTYASMGLAVKFDVGAQNRLSEELDLTTNAGYTIGKSIAKGSGADEEQTKKAGVIGYVGLFGVIDLVESLAIAGAVPLGAMTQDNALILSQAANVGAMGWLLAHAFSIHGALTVGRKMYNHVNPYRWEDQQTVPPIAPTGDIAVLTTQPAVAAQIEIDQVNKAE